MTDPLRPPDTDNDGYGWLGDGVAGRTGDPDTDDEPWAIPDDPLAPARGCLLGMALGAVAWTLLFLLAVFAWRLR